MKFPRIGLRITKSAIAVFLCLAMDIVMRLVLPNELGPQLYSPFFSSLAAIYSLNNRKGNSVQLAKLRVFGSFVGGGFGVAFLYGVLALLPMVGLVPDSIWYLMSEYVFIAAGILLLFYLAVWLKLQHMVFIAGLTFLAVSVGNRTELPYYMYAINRIGSTVIGVFISLGVNFLSFHSHRHRHVTVVSSLDGVFLRGNSVLTNYQKYHLENLLDDGIDLYFNTNRSPATLFKVFDQVELRQSIVIMNGSATFDLQTKHFDHVLTMAKETEQNIIAILDSHHLNYFAHVITDDSLHIYYKKLIHFGDEYFYKTRKNEYFRNFSKAAIPGDEHASYFIVIAPNQTLLAIQSQFQGECADVVTYCTHYHELDATDFSVLRITSKAADKYAAFLKIKTEKAPEYLVALGHHDIDLPYFEKGDERICFEDAEPGILKKATRILKGHSDHKIIQVIEGLYYGKKPTPSIKK